MKIYLYVLLIAACYFNSTSYSQTVEDPVVASVKSHRITLSQFEKRYSNYLIATGIKDNYVVRKSILDNMINEIILYHYTNNRTVFNNEEYKKEIEWIRKQAIISYLKDQEVYAKLVATESELREAFVRSNEEIAARHLYASTYEEAQNLYQLIQSGISFNSLAKQTFTDSVLKNNGGYLGYFKWGEMDPNFEEVAFSMKVGDISEPVKTSTGYSIIKLEHRFTNPLLTENEFQNKKSSLEREVRIRKKSGAEKEFLNKIFNKELLVFNEESLRNILNVFQGNIIIDQESNFSNGSESNCVEYEGMIFTQFEIERRLREIPYYHFQKMTSINRIKEAVEGLIAQDMLLELAHEKGYNKSHQVLEATEQLQMNLFMNYKRDDVVENWDIPDSLVMNYYYDNIHLFSSPREINIQEIIVADKELADSLYNILLEGGEFGNLAQKHSIREWSAQNNGVLGLAPLSKFGIFKELLWDSPLADVVGPLQIGRLFGIFKVIEKKESIPFRFAEINNEVKILAKRERKKSVFMDYIRQSRDSINPLIDEQVLSNYDF